MQLKDKCIFMQRFLNSWYVLSMNFLDESSQYTFWLHTLFPDKLKKIHTSKYEKGKTACTANKSMKQNISVEEWQKSYKTKNILEISQVTLMVIVSNVNELTFSIRYRGSEQIQKLKIAESTYTLSVNVSF